MWYREAQQGIMNLDNSLFQGAEQAINNWLIDQLWDATGSPDKARHGFYEFEDEINIPNFLKKYISKVELFEGNGGYYDPASKVLKLPRKIPKNQYNSLLSTVLHEIRHAVDPRMQNKSYMSKNYTQFKVPQYIYFEIISFFNNNQKIQSYDEFIISQIQKTYKGNIQDLVANQKLLLEYIESTKKLYPISAYQKAIEFITKGINPYLDNPMEHSSQLGDVRRAIDKSNLDVIKQKYYPNLNIKQWKDYLKNTLYNTNSAEFETLSNQLQELSGKSISLIVKNTKDPKWQKQYAKQISNVLSEYVVPGNPLTNLVRKENRLSPSNPDAGKNLTTFMSQAQNLEKLAESNPRAWNKFINSTFATRMISSKLYNVFKNIGTGSKSLSGSLKNLNMNSPLWGLLEPALEFGLYQFGLYLENPQAYSLETSEQKTIKDLNAKINEIIADPKISDKRGYFIQNYGSYLKTLGSMEQNELLGKFPIVGFNNFMNIGKNIGQK